jgi:hypothetical protein
MISDTSQSTITDLVDPDKFPIWDLKQQTPIYKSLWGSYLGKIRYDIGHQMIVRDSQIEHPASGKGVYLVLPEIKKKLNIGDFIGFVPGRLF